MRFILFLFFIAALNLSGQTVSFGTNGVQEVAGIKYWVTSDIANDGTISISLSPVNIENLDRQILKDNSDIEAIDVKISRLMSSWAEIEYRWSAII